MGYRDNTGRVVKDVPEECVPAGCEGVMHGVVGEGGCGVGGAEDKVVLLGFGVPPGVPGCTEALTLRSQLPVLRGRLWGKGLD